MIKLINGVATPYSIGQLKRDNKTTGFPETITDDLLNDYGVFRVKKTPAPDIDYSTHKLTQGEPVLVDGEWVSTWIIDQLTEDELNEIYESSIPKEVTMRQARAALIKSGHIGLIQPAIDDIEDPIERELVQNEWDTSSTISRGRGVVQAIGLKIFTKEQLDSLFILASEQP